MKRHLPPFYSTLIEMTQNKSCIIDRVVARVNFRRYFFLNTPFRLSLPLTMLFFLGVFFSIEILSAQTKISKQPNIVFLLIDDLGYGECGFNGGKEILTPQIDRLAKEGAILENHYVQPVCSPSRAALLTGRYPTHTGVYTIVSPGSGKGLPLNERTLADALRSAGYQTAITGKWHLGEASKFFQPNARGFDYQYGHFLGNIDYFTHRRNSQPDWYRNGEAIIEEGYSTHLIAREACRTIESSDHSKPLFLYVPFNGVHSPYQVPEQYLQPYAHMSGDRQKIAGMLAAIDEAVGQITQSLTKAGMIENTLIIVSSDNGAPPPGNNFPLRDFKATIYEGGIRGVAFANWPGHINAGQLISEPMHMVDWYPTLVKLAGGTLDQPLPIDGLDVWPMITQSAHSPHDAILSVSTRGPRLSAIRMGNWKLIVLESSNGQATGKIAAMYEPRALFNLADDPSEKINLASKYPERVIAMHQRLDELLKGAVPFGAVDTPAEN